MRHVDREVTALVDDRLPDERRDRVLAHLVRCPPCARLVEEERASRRALHDAGPVQPPPHLTDRLLAVPDEARTPGPVPGWAQRVVEDRRTRKRLLVSLTTVTAGAVGVVGALVTVGMLTERAATPADMLADVRVAHQLDPGRLALVSQTPTEQPASSPVPVSDTEAVLTWMAAEGWATPAGLPAGLRVSDVKAHPDEGVLEVGLVGRGAYVRLIEQRGHLEPRVRDELEPVTVAGGSAYRVPGQEHGYVVQCAENVVMVVATTTIGEEVVAALPRAPYDTGVLGLVDRGWDTVTAWTDAAVG